MFISMKIYVSDLVILDFQGFMDIASRYYYCHSNIHELQRIGVDFVASLEVHGTVLDDKCNIEPLKLTWADRLFWVAGIHHDGLR